MKIRHLHLAFGLPALLLGLYAVHAGWQWREALDLQRAVAQAARLEPAAPPQPAGTPTAPAVAGPGVGAGNADSMPGPGATPVASAAAAPPPDWHRHPEARLAHANALAAAGDPEAAARAYTALIRPDDLDAIGRDALYNLANDYLRQGLAASRGDDPSLGLPLIELAKQRYRDLLRADPGDWDARYNLERALRLAPEEDGSVERDPEQPAERRQVRLPGLAQQELP